MALSETLGFPDLLVNSKCVCMGGGPHLISFHNEQVAVPGPGCGGETPHLYTLLVTLVMEGAPAPIQVPSRPAPHRWGIDGAYICAFPVFASPGMDDIFYIFLIFFEFFLDIFIQKNHLDFFHFLFSPHFFCATIVSHLHSPLA